MVLQGRLNALEPVIGIREQRRTSLAVALSRRCSMSDEEESIPIVAAWHARQEKQEKRRRSLALSGLTVAAMEDSSGSGGDNAERELQNGASADASVVAAAEAVSCSSMERCGAVAVAVGTVAAARELALAARRKRIAFTPGRQQPVAPESA